MSDVDRRGPVDTRLISLTSALRTHLLVVAAVASATALAVVAQAEALATGLRDLVADPGADIATMLWVLVSVAVLRGAATAVTEWSSARAMTSLRDEVRSRVLDHAVLDADRATGGVASREAAIATTGVDQLEPYVRQFLPALALAVTVPLVAGARILFADLLSAVLIAVTVPLIPVFMVLIGRMTERRTARQWAVLQRLGAHFLDVLEGLPTLRLFGRADAQRNSVHEVSEQYRATTLGALRIAFLSALALELIATLSVALIAVEIGLRLAGGSLDLGTALVVLLLTPECYLPLRRVGASFHAAQAGLDASDDLHDLLARPTLPVGDRTGAGTGPLRVRDVELERGGRSIARGIDLDIAPGTITAVYGPSGIGKSTLIDACRARLAESVRCDHRRPAHRPARRCDERAPRRARPRSGVVGRPARRDRPAPRRQAPASWPTRCAPPPTPPTRWCSRRWPVWGSPTQRPIARGRARWRGGAPTSCQGANSAGSRWPGRWWRCVTAAPGSSSPTNPAPTSTTPTPRRCGARCSNLPTGTEPPSWWPPTTPAAGPSPPGSSTSARRTPRRRRLDRRRRHRDRGARPTSRSR